MFDNISLWSLYELILSSSVRTVFEKSHQICLKSSIIGIQESMAMSKQSI